jgi:hypothetical protein
MKKIMLALGLSSLLATGVVAANTVLEELNAQITQLLEPFQDENTTAQIAFDAIETDNERTNKVALHGSFSKIGMHNKIAINLNNISYDYGDGTAPTTIVKGDVEFDLTKAIPQDQLNLLIPYALNDLETQVKSYFDSYEDAFSFRGVITSTTKNDQGDYTGLSALIAAKVDLDKLPADKSSNEVMFTDVVVSVSLDLKSGISVDSFMISNPDYKAFDKNDAGLKELLDQLLAQDPGTMQGVAQLVELVDSLATSLIESKPILSIFSLLKDYQS